MVSCRTKVILNSSLPNQFEEKMWDPQTLEEDYKDRFSKTNHWRVRKNDAHSAPSFFQVQEIRFIPNKFKKTAWRCVCNNQLRLPLINKNKQTLLWVRNAGHAPVENTTRMWNQKQPPSRKQTQQKRKKTHALWRLDLETKAKDGRPGWIAAAENCNAVVDEFVQHRKMLEVRFRITMSKISWLDCVSSWSDSECIWQALRLGGRKA